MRRRRRWLSAWTLGPLLAGGLIAAIMLAALATMIISITGAQGACGTSQPAGGMIAASGPGQVTGIPHELLAIYEQAAARYSLGSDGWAYLAAINYVETDFGHNLSTSSAGAVGWMQFMPDSWRIYGVDANGDGTGDPYDKWDAIFAAAGLLRASGAPGSWSRAIFAYNHAGWYVSQVSARAQQYLAAGTGGAIASAQSTLAPATAQAQSPGLITDAGGVVAATIYGNNHDDNGHGAYQGESLAQDYASGSPPYAELGGRIDQQATLLGHLPPGTALEITNPLTGQSITAYKHDFGYGQGTATLHAHRYRIDLWWQTAYAIGIHDSALVQLQLTTTAPTVASCQPQTASAATVPGATTKILPDGTAVAPADAPPAVQAMIAAGNRLIHFDYSWGGGHCVAAMNQQHPDPAGSCPGQQEYGSPGYDCSSTVSYVLWGGGLSPLIGNTPETSGTLMSMGAPGPGRWVSWYTNPGHVYMQVAGIYMNTENGKYLHSPPQPPTTGPRWSTANALDSPHRAGYIVRHPPGL